MFAISNIRGWLWWPVVAILLLASGTACGQAPAGSAAGDQGVLVTAPVRVDGKVLFSVRGITSYPARERARQIREQILTAARDESLDPADLRITELEDRLRIELGDHVLVTLVPVDAELEQVPLTILAEITQERIRQSLVKYRADRSAEALALSGLYFAGLTAGLALLIWLIGKLRAWSRNLLDTRISASIEELEKKSKRLLRSMHMWRIARGALGALFILVYLLIAYFYLHSVLGTFPWTRGFALVMLELVSDPLIAMTEGILASLPNLAFLVVLFIVVRFLLRLMHALFRSVERREIVLTNFEPDWGMPTYRILRVIVIAFAVVVAYPYIPGSDSAAFKGVSLFLGVMLSLGSTSFIANMIAGLTMTYRGAYRVGDWVRIDGEDGRVEEMRMMVMRLRTRKNELVTIPNSVILNTNVKNFSARDASQGILLHTEISIGYDTPWRQVEAMLIEAAGRTPGIIPEPAPFVLHRRLGDFAVIYELNAAIGEPERMPRLYTELHRNILDVFNENAVQIMSPAYVADPEQPKIAPPS